MSFWTVLQIWASGAVIFWIWVYGYARFVNEDTAHARQRIFWGVIGFALIWPLVLILGPIAEYLYRDDEEVEM